VERDGVSRSDEGRAGKRVSGAAALPTVTIEAAAIAVGLCGPGRLSVRDETSSTLTGFVATSCDGRAGSKAASGEIRNAFPFR
jgi:hypothetical protein